MPKRRIFTIGFELPGDDFEYVPFDSDQSLLDTDIVLFEVGFGDHYLTGSYQGERLFDHQDSVRVAQNLQHWRAELAAATNAGKLVIVFLVKPLSYFRYTGEQQISGTGRSRVRTDIVSRVESYEAVPYVVSAEAKSGREVQLTKDATYLAPYWQEFQQYSAYEAFIDGKFTHSLLVTKTANKTVGAAVQGKGTLLFLPPLRYDEKEFTEEDEEKEEIVWTPAALKFGKRLSSALAGLSDAVRSGRLATPPPSWALDSAYTTPEESLIQMQISELMAKITDLQQRRTELEQQLQQAGSIRALLYEQGKPLERAVREALVLFGFSAVRFAERDSEFDVIFESPEGRCLGEVEGKDNKAVNIDKFSQLERNLQEDFARDGITEFAKGVLFGNPERLKAPSDRGEAFTEKCVTAAKRARIALVRTPDLFDPVRYLKSHLDLEYAKLCRQAILETAGNIVVFPVAPSSSASVKQEKGVEVSTGDIAPES